MTLHGLQCLNISQRGKQNAPNQGVRKEKGRPHIHGMILSSQNKKRKQLYDCFSTKA